MDFTPAQLQSLVLYYAAKAHDWEVMCAQASSQLSTCQAKVSALEATAKAADERIEELNAMVRDISGAKMDLLDEVTRLKAITPAGLSAAVDVQEFAAKVKAKVKAIDYDTQA